MKRRRVFEFGKAIAVTVYHMQGPRTAIAAKVGTLTCDLTPPSVKRKRAFTRPFKLQVRWCPDTAPGEVCHTSAGKPGRRSNEGHAAEERCMCLPINYANAQGPVSPPQHAAFVISEGDAAVMLWPQQR